MAYNLNERHRLHAPDVVQRRNFFYEGTAYIKCGWATDTIVGPTAEWVRDGMADSEYNGEPFFILHGLQEESKFVCVVHHISDSTLYVTCLQHMISLYVVFDRIWVPIRTMTGLGANGEIPPKNSFQKVSIFDTSYLSQKWCSYCKEANHMHL
jgi:hypothetical protein